MSDLLELRDKSLIDMLLEEQQSIDTPVGRVAEAAESRLRGQGEASYRNLVPLTAPGKGEQYAFRVDLDRCSGCKGCVTACHSMNGLDENETWRDVGLLVGGGKAETYQQTITTACHHCVEPACLIGCPVNAYEKDEASGIVLHLDDQCIGCQYCVLKCPYDVPKYSAKRGIVRKCDMCHSRLSVGEAPACAQACPHEAISIQTVSVEEVVDRSSVDDGFLPGSPPPGYTKPTTRYVSKNSFPTNAEAADANKLRPQYAHWPLVGLLVLSQLGVGGMLGAALLSARLDTVASGWFFSIGWALLHAGLLCSVLHLGQPLKAWRIFLGIRRSWLSREAVAFGACSAVSLVPLAAYVFADGLRSSFGFPADQFQSMGSVSTAAIGMLGILTSVYIYVDTKRSFWKFAYTAGKFFGTATLGLASLALIVSGGATEFAIVLMGSGLGKVALEWFSFRDNQATRSLAEGPLRPWRMARIGLAVLAYLALVPASSVTSSVWLSSAAFVAILGGEVLERALYFKAVNAPKMPGAVSS